MLKSLKEKYFLDLENAVCLKHYKYANYYDVKNFIFSCDACFQSMDFIKFNDVCLQHNRYTIFYDPENRSFHCEICNQNASFINYKGICLQHFQNLT